MLFIDRLIEKIIETKLFDAIRDHQPPTKNNYQEFTMLFFGIPKESNELLIKIKLECHTPKKVSQEPAIKQIKVR